MGVIKDLTGSFSGGLQLLSGFGMIAKRGTGTIVVLVTEERFRMVRANNLSGSGGANQAYVLGHSDQELARLNEQARIVEPITRRFFGDAGLVSGMRVLDVGSGAGEVSFLAADLVGDTGTIVGVDRASAAVEVARARAIASGRRNVSFREGDAAEIKFDEPFDASSAALSSYFKMILRICSQSLPSTWGQEA